MTNRFISDEEEALDIYNQLKVQIDKKDAENNLASSMDNGSSADLSGEYTDSAGKHFLIKKCKGDAYSLTYDGDPKIEIEIDSLRAFELATASKRLSKNI